MPSLKRGRLNSWVSRYDTVSFRNSSYLRVLKIDDIWKTCRSNLLQIMAMKSFEFLRVNLQIKKNNDNLLSQWSISFILSLFAI